MGFVAFYSCSESDITPTEDRNYYLAPYGSTAEEQTMMKEFYNTNKVYVLFNDLIEKRSLGYDSDGNEAFSDLTVNLGYRMTTVSSNLIFEYEYLETIAEKRAAAEFITEKFLPSLSAELRPFSFLLVNKINQYTYNSTYSEYELTNPPVYSGWRATAVAVEGVDEMNEAEQTAYKYSLLKSIINKSITTQPESLFDEFYEVSARFYGKYSFDPQNDEKFEGWVFDFSDLRTTGLLSAYMYVMNDSYPNGFVNFMAKADWQGTLLDVGDYIDLVFSGTDAEIRAEHGAFPLVIRKYEIMRQIIVDLGVIL